MDACYVRQTKTLLQLEDLEPGDTFVVYGCEHYANPPVWLVTDHDPDAEGAVRCVNVFCGVLGHFRKDVSVIEVKPEGQVKFMRVRG